jgi:hypothetical protein
MEILKNNPVYSQRVDGFELAYREMVNPPAPPKTSPIPDWAKSALKKSDDTQEKK